MGIYKLNSTLELLIVSLSTETNTWRLNIILQKVLNCDISCPENKLFHSI